MYAGQNYIVEDKENEGKRNRSSVLASSVVALQLQRARVAGGARVAAGSRSRMLPEPRARGAGRCGAAGSRSCVRAE